MNKLLNFTFLLLVILVKTANAQTLPSYVSAQGLVAWWNLDGDAKDASSFKNHGKLFGITPTSDRNGETGKAVYFAGDKQRIEIPDKPSLRCKTISISLWVKNERYGLASFLYKANRSNASSESYSVNSVPSVAVKINSGCKPWEGWSSSNFRTDNLLNTWTHLAITYDGNVMLHYVNGILVSRARGDGPIDTCKGGNIHLGYCWDEWPFSFKGLMDEVGIWNRALSGEEVMKLFDGNNPPSAPLCFWKLPVKGKNGNIDTIQICVDSLHQRVFFKLNNSENLHGYTLQVNDAKQNPLFYQKIEGHGAYFILADASAWQRTKYFDDYDVKVDGISVGIEEKDLKTTATPEITYPEGSEDLFLMVWDSQYYMREILKFRLWRP